jgi:uncharacterized protein YlxW (UPF0749 family)
MTVATEPRRPIHLLWLIGLSASIYAVNLALVTDLQAASDSQVAGQQATSQAALNLLQASDARLASQVQQAASDLQATNAGYGQAAQTLATLEQRLSSLGKSAGALRALPALPAVSSGSVKAPVVHTTTGASGAKP